MSVAKNDGNPVTGKRIVVYFLWYTILFVCCCVAVFYPFWSTGTGLIYKSDGLWQHYHALIFYGKWLRSIIRSILFDHCLRVPLWDYSIGYGADVLSTFSYYVIGDPFALLSALVPVRYTEVLYNCLVILRLYFAGAAFSIFCLYHKKKKAAVLAGALCYAFCCYAVYGGLKHPFFLNPMIFFPLLLLGADRVFEKKKSGFFVFMVFLCTVSNFYFFYMIVLGCIIYVLLRFFTFPHKKPLRELGLCTGHFLILGLIGLLMGMAIFLPTLHMFFDTLRSGSESEISLLYPARYYARLLRSFVFGRGTGYWTLLGYAWPTVPALILLFTEKLPFFRHSFFSEENNGGRVRHMLRLGFVIFTIVLLLPAGGKVFNGFSYVCNRWVWIYSALVSYILTYVWDQAADHIGRKTWYPAAVSCMIFLICLHLSWNNYWRFDKGHLNDLKLFLPYGKAYKTLSSDHDTEMDQWTREEPEDIWRYEKSSYTTTNEAVVYGYRGLQAYWSLTAGTVSSYLLDMRLNPYAAFSYSGVDSRTILDELASVRYYISYDGYAPYGYKKIVDKSGQKHGYAVYENTMALPLAYYYSAYITKEQWDEMDPAKRQASLMQAAVLDAEPDSLSDAVQVENTAELETLAEEVPCHLKAGKNAKILGDHSFRIRKKRGKLELEFEGKENCETYIMIRNLKVESSKGRFVFRAQGKREAKGYFVSSRSRCDYGQTDVLLNLGYSKEAQTHAVLSISRKCRCTYDDIRIICLPVDGYEQAVKVLSGQDVQVRPEVNRLYGDISFDQPGILCFSVPWSSGWTAEVDGKPVELFRANTMYMAVELDRGHHEVILRYCTPGLKAGLIMSLAGWILLLVLCRVSAKERLQRNLYGDRAGNGEG